MRFFTALLAASLPLSTNGGQAQLLPAGEFAARDGRPGPGKTWKVSDAQGQALAAALSAVAAQTPVVIDYEHQTLHAAANGQPAPAAGWIGAATWQPGKGLYADVRWTAKAKAAIDAEEYRFISPVIHYDDSGAITEVALAALTNHPGLLGMDAAVAQLNAQLATTTATPEPTMSALLASLLTAIGLPATTTEADALAAVSALSATAKAAGAKPAVPAALTAALGLSAGADEQAALAAVTTLKGGTADTVALVASLQGQVSTLTAQLTESAVVADVDAAIKAGKLTVAQRDVYLGIGRKDRAMLTAVLAAAPVIEGLAGQNAGGQQHEGGGGGGTEALTAQQTKIAAQLGISAKDYLAHLAATKTAA